MLIRLNAVVSITREGFLGPRATVLIPIPESLRECDWREYSLREVVQLLDDDVLRLCQVTVEFATTLDS